jgi:hypothetical protein
MPRHASNYQIANQNHMAKGGHTRPNVEKPFQNHHFILFEDERVV